MVTEQEHVKVGEGGIISGLAWLPRGSTLGGALGEAERARPVDLESRVVSNLCGRGVHSTVCF